MYGLRDKHGEPQAKAGADQHRCHYPDRPHACVYEKGKQKARAATNAANDHEKQGEPQEIGATSKTPRTRSRRSSHHERRTPPRTPPAVEQRRPDVRLDFTEDPPLASCHETPPSAGSRALCRSTEPPTEAQPISDLAAVTARRGAPPPGWPERPHNPQSHPGKTAPAREVSPSRSRVDSYSGRTCSPAQRRR